MSFSPKQFALSVKLQDQQTLEELIWINAALNAGMKSLLLDPRKTLDAKLSEIKEILPKTSENSLRFLKLIVRENQLKNFGKILNEYQKILANSLSRGEIITAMPMSPEEVEAVEEKIAKKVGRKVLLSAMVDPKILGGVIIKIGDKTVDNSFKNRLRALR